MTADLKNRMLVVKIDDQITASKLSNSKTQKIRKN
jgi:hypothetical protein